MLIDVTDLNRRSIHSTPRPSACALSVFPWVRFRSAKAATKMHTLLAPKASRDYLAVPAAYQALRCGARQTSGISNQQLRLTCADHRSALSLSLAGRTILQMDQTASSYQAFLRNY